VSGDPFAAERERALAAEPRLPRAYRELEDDRAWAPLLHGLRLLVREEVARADSADLFDETGIDPFGRASAKSALRAVVFARAERELVDPMPPAQVKKVRSRLAEAAGLPAGPLIVKGDAARAALRADVVDALHKIIAEDLEGRFPAR